MNILRIGRNVTIIAFLFSLLFHISSILYIFSQKTHRYIPEEIDHNQQQVPQALQSSSVKTPADRQEWAATQARAGNFGAPVFFEETKEDPEDSSSFAESTETESMQQAPEIAEKEIDTPASEQTEEINPETETIAEKIENEMVQTTMPSMGIIQHNSPVSVAAISPLQSQAPKPTSSFAPTSPKGYEGHGKASVSAKATTDTSADKQKKAPQSQTKQPQQNPFAQTPRTSSFAKATANKSKPPITLAELTQGFLHQRKEQSGTYGISMMGMKRGIPSEEQMKYERYLQKLSWCIQNSFRINSHKQPAPANVTEPHIFFSLNRDGILQQLSIKKSSGNMYVDQYILSIFRDASTSFPPVPSYLTDDPFSITCIVS
jgi:hypothetical protein